MAAALRAASRQCRVQLPANSRPLFTKSTPKPSSPLRTGIYTTAFVVSAGLFAVYYFDARAAIHRYFFTPLLRNIFDAETGHKIAVRVLRSGFGPRDPVPDDERLKFQLWGREISNPVGLAAGFDKDGEAIDGLFNLGFSWVEIGSVTPKPQEGNARPRVFHLPEDSSLINRYGFPSKGHCAVLARLRARIPRYLDAPAHSASFRDGSVLAVNLGKNKDSPADSVDDFVAGVRTFGPYSDVLVINVSSPNTPGLRGLQNRDSLISLLKAVAQARDDLPPPYLIDHKPRILLKIAPDLNESQLVDVAQVVIDNAIDGVIVSNTTIQRPSSLVDANRAEAGGLSGPPLKPLSLAALRTLRANLPAEIPLIGCGGISSGADALEFAKAGATLVQIYTHFGYDGAGTCRRVKDEIVGLLAEENQTWAQVVNKATSKLSLQLPGEPTVGQLISEAEELGKLLDRLGDKLEHETASRS